ncbi:Helicase associated domain protein [Streptomyces globisporus]|uniref:DEAD/DEAH box helicase n=1 Tax=Streptomyces globisporus TaxID=1908 RepID=UPI003625932D
MTGEITLFPHQAEAVEAIVAGLEIRPGRRIPKNGLRGQVHAACGTGKTFIAAGAAQRISPHGRVLVLLPTLELLAQTVREWRAFGRSGPMVAVCSMDADPRLYDLRVPSTTNAPQLALRYGSGPVTVFATYSSLPVLTEAHEGAYGLPMDVWDLVCVDEAHRTSGSLGKAWAVVHDQEQLPAVRRLYLTATPRIWMERPRPRWSRKGEVEAPGDGRRPVDRLPKELACSMSDERIYGPVLWALDLSDAIARGLLARYQIVVVELRDERLTLEKLYGEERFEEHVRGERLAVLQAALLETMAEHGLQRCITFHHRTIEAQAFSVGLGRVAGRLHAADPERHPREVWSGWLSGEHEPEERAENLHQFGARAGRAVMSNCRVLGEGVDCPSVDSVALIDPKGSAVDIVQAIGRALRQKPGQDKLATLIVPVFLGPDETPEDMPYSASYRPLLKVLSGLRAHDERAVEMLAIPSEDLHRTKPMSPWLGPAPEDDDEEEQRLLLRFAVHRDPALVARMVEYNLIEPEHTNWRAGHRAAVAYREREGDLAVPYNHVESGNERSTDGLSREGGFPLGRWLSDQRRAMRAGTMLPERAEDLEALGIVWDPADAAWEENLSAAKAYFAAYGTLAAPVTAMMMDRPVGQWLANARKKNGLGKDQARARRRAAALAAIDPDWNPDWPIDWQRHYAALKGLVAPGSVLGHVQPGAMVNGLDVGAWLAAQQDGWERLAAAQRERLVQLGVRPPEKPATEAVGGKARPRRATGGARAGAFERGIAALAQYAARERTVVVARSWSEEMPDGTSVRLGVWLSNVKSRRATLTGEQLQRLAGLGLEWAAAGRPS